MSRETDIEELRRLGREAEDSACAARWEDFERLASDWVAAVRAMLAAGEAPAEWLVEAAAVHGRLLALGERRREGLREALQEARQRRRAAAAYAGRTP